MKVHRTEIKLLDIDLTGTCNLSCPLCERNIATSQSLCKPNIRPLDELIEQMELFPSLECVVVAGIVSEPLMYPYFTEYIKYLKSRNIRIVLCSNASIQNTDFWYKLGGIMQAEDEIIFTVCGSTQELHEKYRVGSSLEKILDNAEAFRQGSGDKKNDYIQYIRFEYNKDDIVSKQMMDIFDKFNNVYKIDSEQYVKDVEYINDFDKKQINMISSKEKVIKLLINEMTTSMDSIEIDCYNFKNKRICIDQFGKIHNGWTPSIYANDKSVEIDDDGYLDFSFVVNFGCKECFKCSSKTKYLYRLFEEDIDE